MPSFKGQKASHKKQVLIKMNTKFIKLGSTLAIAALILISDAYAQWGRRGGYYGRGPYGMVMRPHVSIGIGGVFGGGYWGYRPGVGVSVGVGFPGGGVYIGHQLPIGYRRVYVGGQPYYYYNDRYYREREGGYEMIDAPLGATIKRLPRGTQKQIINGETYYEANGTYLQEDRNENGDRVYIIVGKNGRLDTREAHKRMMETEDRNDRYYNNNRNNIDDGNNQREEDIVVRNGNKDLDADNGDAVYNVGPRVGDQFYRLPKDSRAITIEGKKQYLSPAGTYYKEIIVDGRSVYEVVKVK